MAASVHCMRKVTVTRYTNVFLGRVAPKRVCVGEDTREDVETKQSVEGAGRRREERRQPLSSCLKQRKTESERTTQQRQMLRAQPKGN